MNQLEREGFFYGDDKSLTSLSNQKELADLFIGLLDLLETSNITITGNPLSNDFYNAIDIIQKGQRVKRNI